MSEATPAAGGQGAAPAAAPAATSAALNAPAAAPAAPTSQQVTPAAPAPAAPAALEWLKDADETTVGYVQNKGWTDPKQVLEGYRNLEKLLGADKAGNAIVLPKADADPKEWAAVWDKLGRPSDPTGYKVTLPEGGNADFQTAALAKLHELGVPKGMGEQLINWYNEQATGQMQQMEAAKAQAFQQQDAQIKQEWGAAYTQNLAQAQAAKRMLGLDDATIDKVSDALGHAATMKLLQNIGSKAAEADFVAGDGSTNFSAMTPAQAKAEIQALQSDKGFMAKYLKGDQEAKAKMLRLHEFAYPAEG